MSEASALLSEQLSLAGIPHETEVMFMKGRRFRFDILIKSDDLAIEVDGGTWVNGRHSRGYGVESDCVKYNEALILGYHVLRVTPKHVKNGQALDWVRRRLGVDDIQVDPRPLSLLQ